MEGATEALKASPVTTSAMPVSSSTSPHAVLHGRGDRREVGRARGAVDERQAVEQRGRAGRADDQVLEARLERRRPPHLRRAHDVERDGEQLEADEHRHEVRRAGEDDHAEHGREEQAVELAVARLPHGDAAPREQHRDGRAHDEEQREHRA